MKKVIFTLCLLISVYSSFADWIQANGPYGGHVQSIKRLGNRLYAATMRGFFVSDDAGASWTYKPINAYDVYSSSMEIEYLSATEIFVSRQSDGVYRSTDDGNTWTKVTSNLSASSFYAVAKLSNGTYLMGGQALYTSPDGVNWTQSSLNPANSFNYQLITEINGLVYLGAYNAGLYRSADMGATWQAVNTGLTNISGTANPGALVSYGSDLYLATSNLGLFKSTNAGDTWTSYSGANTILLQVYNNELYVMSSAGTLYRNNPAIDNTFTLINNFNRINSQYISDFALLGNEVFVSNNGFGIWKETLGLPASITETNNGLLAGADVNVFTSLNNTLFAGTDRMGVYKSTDGGVNWQYSSNGVGSYMITGMATVDNDIYAMTINTGIYKSSDQGATWTLFNSGIGSNYVISFAKAGNDFYAGGANGRVYKSTGGTSAWQLLNTGLPNDYINKLVYNGTSLFALTSANRLYKLDLPGTTWTACNNGLPASVYTRSLLADGSKLYVSLSSNATSLFQSTDNGANWTPASNGIPAYTTLNDMFLISSGQIIGLSDNEVYKTTNAGLCWKAANSASGFKPAYSNTVYYFNNKIWATPNNNGIWYRSIDETPANSDYTPPVISGPGSVCNPASVNLTYSVPYRYGSTYNWTIPAGSTLVGGSTANSAVTIKMGNTSGTISVTESNTGCTSAAATKFITVGAPATPVIVGPSDVCANVSGNVYSVQNPVAGSTYNWNVSPNATYTNISATSIEVTFAPGSGGVFVQEISGSCSSIIAGKSVVVGSASQGPLSNSRVCEDGVVHLYVEGAYGNSTFNWTVSGNATIYYDQHAPYIFVNAASGGFDVTVQETTLYGCVGPVLSTHLETLPKPQTSVITGPDFVCETSGTTATYSVVNTDDSYYQWGVPYPAYIVSGDGSNTIEVDWMGTSGQITVIENHLTCFGVQQTKDVTIVPNTPIASATISGSSSACINQEIDLSVTGKQGSTFAWTVPSGATVVSGQGTAQVRVNVNQASGTVSVVETDVCGNTGPLNSLPVSAHGYEIPSQQLTCASTTFCQTIRAAAPISPGVIGLDFILHYDANLLTPTGRVTLGTVATSYGAYAVNTTVPGTVYVTLYLNQAPSNVFFSGTGDIACVEFSRTSAFIAPMTTQITAEQVVESTLNSTNDICAPVAATLDLFMIVKGKLTYRNSTKVITSSAVTSVQATDQSCIALSAPAITLGATGIFQVPATGAMNIKVNRDIIGDATVDPLNCSNIMLAINATDRNRAADISTFKVTNPTVYELISSDVNLDGKVTAGDVTLISARAVNLYNCEFPQSNYTWNGTTYVPVSNYQKSKDWVFVPSILINDPSYTAGMSKNHVPQFPQCYLLQPLSPCNTTTVPTIEGILLGDVNGNWSGGTTFANIRTGAPEVTINLQAAVSLGNDNYLVPVSCDSDEFSALDFEIDYNGANVSVINVTPATSNTSFGYVWNNVQNEKILVTAYSSVPLTDVSALLYLTLHAPDGLSVSDIESTTAYLNDVEARVNLGNTVTGTQNAAGTLVVDAYPNPFTDQFNVLLYSARSSEFNVTVTDLTGAEVYSTVCSGNQSVNLGSQLPAGVYMLKVTTADESKVMKIVKQ